MKSYTFTKGIESYGFNAKNEKAARQKLKAQLARLGKPKKYYKEFKLVHVGEMNNYPE